jgi:hypothetical protein
VPQTEEEIPGATNFASWNDLDDEDWSDWE